jgi:peptidoglycan LD-endopeptidase LytH
VRPGIAAIGVGAVMALAGCGAEAAAPRDPDPAQQPRARDLVLAHAETNPSDHDANASPRDAAIAVIPDIPMVPVAGVAERDLEDTFGQLRRGARRHGGIDILAPRGTPVVAAMDGWVVNIRREGPGGLALHLLDRSGTYLFYYAHLDRFADRLRPGRAVRQGDLLGYVGDTGNAAGRSPHLHFEVASVEHPRRWWDYEPLNPHTFLTAGVAGAP